MISFSKRISTFFNVGKIVFTSLLHISCLNVYVLQNFQMTVMLRELEKPSQTLKIRLLPGKPSAVRLTSFSDGFRTIEPDKGNHDNDF